MITQYHHTSCTDPVRFVCETLDCHNHKDGPSSMGVAAILTWNQVGANWPHNIFYGKLVPSGALWPFGHILPSLASLANFHITNPQTFIFDFGPGGSFSLPGGSGPPSHHLWFCATPFHWGGLGLNGLFGPFRPPMASTACGPRSIGQVGPKPQLGPPEPILVINPLDPNLAKNPLDTKMAIEAVGPIFGHGPLFQPWPLAMTRGHQTSSASTPLNFRGILSILPCTPYSRLQEWCIYGIIYHYAPFLLRNSMVMFSGQNPAIPNQGPKIQHPFQRRTFQLISLEIHGGNQKIIQGPQTPDSAGGGLVLSFRIHPKVHY
ncbi:hypothetical protein O181_012382 [Austropuccinia psidii MF-1]|uniref:Uncharacterized protein n=1 Tax=Austropuccinia psidii MF-1 TaxID=1389203 RepID=A0A9Q3BXL6_9BASI|nr:hypothetical protein [Austropuccinia psidii MF-1]